MHVGIAGVGRMGAAIAARLLDVGHRVTVWNRTRAKLAPLAAAGAEVVDTPRDLAVRVGATNTMLSNPAALTAVYEGPDGLLRADVTGKLFIEMSTVAPEVEAALADKVRARGGCYLECPVGGSVGPARDGTRLGVAGGAAADFARAKLLLGQLCRRVEHVGAVGAGSSMKLAINLPPMVYHQALGESYPLCRHLGLYPSWLMECLCDTSGAPNVLKAQGAKIASALADGDPGHVRGRSHSQGSRHHGGGGQEPRHDPAPCASDARHFRCGGRGRLGRRDSAAPPAYWPSRNPHEEGSRS